MPSVVIGDDILVAVQLYKDNATFAIDSASTVEAQFLDANGLKMLTTPITCVSGSAGAAWGTGLVVVLAPEVTSLLLTKGEAEIEIQVEDGVNTSGKKTWFTPVTILGHTIA